MADFYQTGVVATLHRLGAAKVDQLERDLERFTIAEPVALVLPCLIDELDRPALPRIVEHLRRVRYLDTVVVSLGRASAGGRGPGPRAVREGPAAGPLHLAGRSPGPGRARPAARRGAA